MKYKKKKLILLLTIIIVLIFLVFLIVKNVIMPELQKPSKNNDKYEILETSNLSLERNYLDLMFSGFVVETLNNERSIYVYITNNTDDIKKSQKVTFVLYDSSNSEILRINSDIKLLRPKESYSLKIPIKKDISNVTDYIVIKG